MEHHAVESVREIIDYIETHLDEKLNLDMAAFAMHYSKYHLHHMFTDMVGMTLHDYIRRRQLTEAARLLVFTEKPIIEAALIAGYESQQAFTGAFKSMYKKTPREYRENKIFYPLQSKLVLHDIPPAPKAADFRIAYAAGGDISVWIDFVSIVIDGFPCFDEEKHLKWLRKSVERRQAFIMRDKEVVIGVAACSRAMGRIDFLGVHPQYRQSGAIQAFLDFIACNILEGQISITTFREGDKADNGQRAAYKRLGFAEAELLTEFGYPTQRLVLRNSPETVADNRP